MATGLYYAETEQGQQALVATTLRGAKLESMRKYGLGCTAILRLDVGVDLKVVSNNVLMKWVDVAVSTHY